MSDGPGKFSDCTGCEITLAARPVLPVETPAEGLREAIARALNSVLGSEDDDHPRHHPAQNSWEVPSEVWWTQWLEAADAVVAALASTAPYRRRRP